LPFFFAGRCTMTNDAAANSPSNFPLMPSVARQVLEEILPTKDQWKRSDIDAEVERIHFGKGGLKGTQSVQRVVKQALRKLVGAGMIEKTVYGHWRWVDRSKSAPVADEIPSIPVPLLDDGEVDDDDEIIIEKEIGDGPERVYVYFNPNDRKLAEFEKRNKWECKIGRTGTTDTVARIVSQGAKTALSRIPVVGLSIRTQDSSALEKALHASLRILESEVEDSPGVEWFMTSPALVEAWYAAFCTAIERLCNGSAPAGPCNAVMAVNAQEPADGRSDRQ
jgi:hypothetical protein